VLDTMRRWQAEGLLGEDLDPALIIGSVLSLTVLPMTASRKWRDDPLRSHIGPEQITRHALALLRHGVGPAKA
jgi:TetR/AcrR family transcriptional regulator